MRRSSSRLVPAKSCHSSSAPNGAAAHRVGGAARFTAIAAGLVLASCGTDPDASVPAIAEGPAYLVGTRVFDDTTTTSYFHLVPSLDADTEIDPSVALEV